MSEQLGMVLWERPVVDYWSICSVGLRRGLRWRQLLMSHPAYVSPQIMVPQRRLATLLDQARRHQALSCMYHQEGESPSLYVDHECASGQFPTITTHILADHTDEVWRIEWSPDGMKLASAGKDRVVVIWQLKVSTSPLMTANGDSLDKQATPKEGGGTQYSVIPLHHLRDHRDSVDALAWSPNGKTLVTGAQKSLYMWDIEVRFILHRRHHR